MKIKKIHTRKWKQLYGSVVLDIDKAGKLAMNSLRKNITKKLQRDNTYVPITEDIFLYRLLKRRITSQSSGYLNGDYNLAWVL